MSDDKSLNEGRSSRKYPSMRDVFDWNCPSMRDFFSQYWRPWQCLYREGRHRNGFRQYHSAVVLRVELLSPQLLGNDTFLLPTWVTTGKCHSWGFSDSFGLPQMPGTCRNLNEKMRLRQVSCLKVVVIWCFCTFATGSTNTKIGMKENIIGREQEIEKLENYLSFIVSIISWLSILYALNGRKVAMWILFRYEMTKIYVFNFWLHQKTHRYGLDGVVWTDPVIW